VSVQFVVIIIIIIIIIIISISILLRRVFYPLLSIHFYRVYL